MSSELIGGRTGTGEVARLKAYSSFEPYELADYRTALARTLPGIAIEIERMPTATLTERLLAERDAPGADLVFGWADTAAQTEGLEGLCASGEADGYVRPTGFSTAFIVDPTALAACGARPVRTWRDLAQDALRGRVAFPNPAVSGAGFLAMSTLLQYHGEAEGWALIEAICANVRAFPGSAWAPAAETGSGAIAVGVTVHIAACKRRAELARLSVVEPQDVIGAEAEVYGMIRSTRNADAARRVIDWVSSEEATALFTGYRKTILSAPTHALFMIDSAKAVAGRAADLARFAAIADGPRELIR